MQSGSISIQRPSRDEWLIRLAVVTSTRGTCERASVGAVIAKDGRIISTGYVGSPSGLPHCTDVGCLPGPDGGCTRTIHAEVNAISFAARYGIATDEATLYCTHSPCANCSRSIINAGIVRVVYENDYRLSDGKDLLKLAGVEVVKHD